MSTIEEAIEKEQQIWEKEQKLRALQKKYREAANIQLKPAPYLVSKFKSITGEEKDFCLRPYQAQSVLHLLLMRRFVLGDDTGLGKTIMVISALCYLWEKNPKLRVLVLTTKSATRQWASEFATFTSGVNVFVYAGVAKARRKVKDAFEACTGPSVLIMSYALARIDYSAFQQWKDFTLILDEVTAAKSVSSRTHKVCRALSRSADKVWGVTATLIKNNLLEGYGIFRIVADWLFSESPGSFMDTYCYVTLIPLSNKRKCPKVVGYKPGAVELFREKIYPYFLSRSKYEVAKDLPMLVRRIVNVGLSVEQLLLYEEALSLVLQLGESVGSVTEKYTQAVIQGTLELKDLTPLSVISYCQSIVNHPFLVARDGNSNKLDALVELFQEGDIAEEKIIIFSRYRKMVDLIVPALNTLYPDTSGPYCTRITGSETDSERELAQRLFQDPNSETHVICLTMAGSDAINLQAAKAIIFYDTPWSAGDFLQILGRMIRIGSVHDSVYAIHMVANDTIDERVLTVLHQKISLVEKVLGKRLHTKESSADSDLSVGESAQVLDDSPDNELLQIFSALHKDAQKMIRDRV